LSRCARQSHLLSVTLSVCTWGDPSPEERPGGSDLRPRGSAVGLPRHHERAPRPSLQQGCCLSSYGENSPSLRRRSEMRSRSRPSPRSPLLPQSSSSPVSTTPTWRLPTTPLRRTLSLQEFRYAVPPSVFSHQEDQRVGPSPQHCLDPCAHELWRGCISYAKLTISYCASLMMRLYLPGRHERRASARGQPKRVTLSCRSS
jgi:hypothetical protein